MPSAAAVRRIINWSSVGQIAIGGFVATLLARLPEVALFKALNTVGLIFDIVGVFLLSDLVVSRANRFALAFDYAYAFVLMSLILMPIGSLLFVPIMGILMDRPSQEVSLGLFLPVMAYVGTPLLLLDMLSNALRLRFYQTMRTRIQFMGWYLLVSGLLLQLAASFIDLASGA